MQSSDTTTLSRPEAAEQAHLPPEAGTYVPAPTLTSRTRSFRLAVGLFLLAPLVAELLLGNLPITALYTLVALAPLYGGGALLIREVVRRTGRGWSSILILA